MAWDITLGCVIIILARIGDVSLGTMRTVAVVSGHRGLAWLFGLLEMTIWVFAVSAVIAHIRTEPAYGLAFALGAATGNYVGVTLQRWLPFGDQVVRVFTREGTPLPEPSSGTRGALPVVSTLAGADFTSARKVCAESQERWSAPHPL